MLDLGLTILCGFLGGLALHRLKVPGGMMLGSVIAVAFLNIQTSHVYMPGVFRTIAQIIAGAYIGMSVNRKDAGRIKALLKPTIFLLTSLFLTNLVIGYLMYLVSPMDLLTALLAAVPGGISDTPLIAADMGADVAKVTVLQFMRLIAGIGLIPIIVKLIDAREVTREGRTISLDMKTIEKPPAVTKSLLLALSVAMVFGLIGSVMGIPAGALLLSMVSVVGLKMIPLDVTMPIWFKRVAQLFSGAYIGSRFGMGDVLQLRFLVFPAIILVVGNILACFVIGYLIHTRFRMSLQQAMLSSSPAGASDMALIASDLGIVGADVAIIQVLRLVGAVAIFPQLIYLLVHSVRK